jgi:hypothetical protein
MIVIDGSNSVCIKWVDHVCTPPWKLNALLDLCNQWLTENCGKRWVAWNYSTEYGYVWIKDPELALVFKLKFGC